jgi:hypothetical protein
VRPHPTPPHPPPLPHCQQLAVRSASLPCRCSPYTPCTCPPPTHPPTHPTASPRALQRHLDQLSDWAPSHELTPGGWFDEAAGGALRQLQEQQQAALELVQLHAESLLEQLRRSSTTVRPARLLACSALLPAAPQGGTAGSFVLSPTAEGGTLSPAWHPSAAAAAALAVVDSVACAAARPSWLWGLLPGSDSATGGGQQASTGATCRPWQPWIPWMCSSACSCCRPTASSAGRRCRQRWRWPCRPPRATPRPCSRPGAAASTKASARRWLAATSSTLGRCGGAAPPVLGSALLHTSGNACWLGPAPAPPGLLAPAQGSARPAPCCIPSPPPTHIHTQT